MAELLVGGLLLLGDIPDVGLDDVDALADLVVGEGRELVLERVDVVDDWLEAADLAVVRVEESGEKAHGRLSIGRVARAAGRPEGASGRPQFWSMPTASPFSFSMIWTSSPPNAGNAGIATPRSIIISPLFHEALTVLPFGNSVAASAAAPKTMAVPRPRVPPTTSARCMVPSGRRASRSGSRGSGRQPEELDAVPNDDDEEGQDRQRAPEQHGANGARGVHLRIGEIRELAALQRCPPPRRAELVAPVVIGDGPDLEAALAVGPMQLQAHWVSGVVRQAPAEAGIGDGTSSSAVSGVAGSGCGGVDGSRPPPVPPSRPSSHRSISCVNETSELNSAPTDSPRWIRLIASPMSGATDRTLSFSIWRDGERGIVSVMTTSRSAEFAMRS